MHQFIYLASEYSFGVASKHVLSVHLQSVFTLHYKDNLTLFSSQTPSILATISLCFLLNLATLLVLYSASTAYHPHIGASMNMHSKMLL